MIVLFQRKMGDIMEKKLYRAREGKLIGGVCMGLAEYFNVDVSLIRLGAVFLCLAGFSGILAYIVALFIIPEKPLGIES